jgi:hypothetical protein
MGILVNESRRRDGSSAIRIKREDLRARERERERERERWC